MSLHVLFSTLLFATVCHAGPWYFISGENSWCDAQRFGGTAFWAEGIYENSRLCAFIPELNLTYACPAPDEYCYSGGGGTFDTRPLQDAPSILLCNTTSSSSLKTVWWQCKSGIELCSPVSGRSNVCLSTFFDNPLRDIVPEPADRAQERASSLASEAAKTTPGIDSTSILPVVSMTMITSLENPPVTTTTALNAAATTGLGSSGNTGIAAGGPNEGSRDSLSTGAVAGIVVGAVVGFAAVMLLSLFLWRRRSSKRLDGRRVELDGVQYKGAPVNYQMKEQPVEVSAWQHPVEAAPRSPVEMPP